MAFLDVTQKVNRDVQKKLFKLKPINFEGLLVNIRQTCPKKNLRFTHIDFQPNGSLLALVNNDHHIYIIDFPNEKLWKLQTVGFCTYIKFSEYTETQLLAGKTNGVIEILNVDTGEVIAKLLGHLHPIVSVSFCKSSVCLSASRYDAIIWDLESFNKMQVLSLEKECALKFVVFIPISNNILVCYNDDIIQIWQAGSFKHLKQFHPSNWKNYYVRSISFSSNGKIMAVSGYLPVLAIFQLNIWKLLKIISLPEYINTIKQMQFIPENFDGGCNKLLAILSGNGTIYFYNIQDNILLSELKSNCEISSFTLPSYNVQYIACLLCSGEVEVYDIAFFTLRNENTITIKAQDASGHKNKLKNYAKKIDLCTKVQLDNVLEVDKLKSIIKEYQEFPEAFRATIWEKILKLPNNVRQYNSIVNHMGVAAFEDLQKTFPLEDKGSIRCLRQILSNLAAWCPFFAQVDYLPCFLYPFIKVFHKKPVACFELCCTIIVNWCQHWFEYYPLPPVNVLAIIDNMLIEHDSSLLQHFSHYNIKPVIYSWSLLESAFSEVLTTKEWLMFWDHVFINEPGFLLCAVVAFLIVQKKFIVMLNKLEDFLDFFHCQRPLEIRKLIAKTYWILKHTSDMNHPSQYLNAFTCLKCGIYPTFLEYPKDIINFQVEHLKILEGQLKDIEYMKENMLKEQKRQQIINEDEVRNEEDRRRLEVEKACIEKIKLYQQNLKAQQDELRKLREDLLDEERAILISTQHKLRNQQASADSNIMKLLGEGLDMSGNFNEIELKNMEEAYELEKLGLARKGRFLNSMSRKAGPSSALTSQLASAHRHTVNLKRELKKARMELESPKKADIALTLSAMDSLIRKIKEELNQDDLSLMTKSDFVKENLKIYGLEKEVKHLQKETSKLLGTLNENNGNSSSCSIGSCRNPQQSCSNKTVRFSTSDY
ncbi:TBC1 domain family member 31 [Anthonomus grandis grandis]|uniref:TBC1 domain family member 31 n=1 Tax=Anthonomus grandis grandis TaxID=2921223 RepID=UPI0021651986|nr:TBC1 domain family member 31 [Anthonomus grandis grandis]